MGHFISETTDPRIHVFAHGRFVLGRSITPLQQNHCIFNVTQFQGKLSRYGPFNHNMRMFSFGQSRDAKLILGLLSSLRN